MLQLGIYDSTAGSLYLDISPRASQVVIVNGEHGFGTLTCVVKMALWEAFMLYDRPGLPHIQITEYGISVWEGRLEDVAIVAGGVRLTAFGYWRALGDATYTGLWAYSGSQGWRPAVAAEYAARTPELYYIDTNNRLYISLVKNTIYAASGNNVATLLYFVPNAGTQLAGYFSLSYDYNLPAASNWVFRIRGLDASFAGLATTTITSTGGAATGTATLDLTATPASIVIVEIFNNAVGTYTDASETGVYYARCTNVVIKGSNSASIYADEIARALVSYVDGINAAQLNSSTALINSPTVALSNEIYQDALPADILDRLALLGDNSSPVALYETGIWEGQTLSFQKRGLTAKTWYVDISALELERTINALVNRTYAVYQDADGRTLRTAANGDSDSAARYGVIRRRSVATQTTSSTQANTQRDAALQDGKDPRPRIAIAFDRVYDGAGSVYPLWMVRAWDTLVIRNLPATLSTQLDRIRQFRIIESQYDVDSNTLTVTPESRLPSLMAQATPQMWDRTPLYQPPDWSGGGSHGHSPHQAGGAAPTGGSGGDAGGGSSYHGRGDY